MHSQTINWGKAKYSTVYSPLDADEEVFCHSDVNGGPETLEENQADFGVLRLGLSAGTSMFGFRLAG